MMYKTFLITVFFTIISCHEPAPTAILIEVIENRDSTGTLLEKYTRTADTYAKQGLFTAYYPTGQVAEEAYYQNDTLHGERKIYREDGNMEIVENYVEGLFIGPFKAYYSNGQLELEGQYENNQMTGEWKRYYDSGELMETVQFEKNEENGPFKEYYKNGTLRTEGAYLEGDFEHGELKKYDETGEVIQIMNCVRGTCRTTWQKEGRNQ